MRAAKAYIGLAVILISLAAPADHARAERGARALLVTGTKIKKSRWVRVLVGRPPRAVSRRAAWAAVAARVVVKAYQAKGFIYARVWHSVDAEGFVRLHVDEGYMTRIELVGSTDIIKHLLFPLDLSLPKGIFQERLVRDGLGRLRVRHRLGALEYNVIPGDWFETELGQRVRERFLQVTVNQVAAADVGGTSGGVRLKLVTDLRWGVNAGGNAGFRNLATKGDSLWASLRIGIPLRQMLFESDAKMRWIYGKFRLSYSFPAGGGSHIYPLFAGETSLYYDGRSDLGLQRVLTLRALVGLGFTWAPKRWFSITLVGRLSYLQHVSVERVDPWYSKTPETDGSLKGGLAVGFRLVDHDYHRRDLQTKAFLTPSILTDGQRTKGSLHFYGQLTLPVDKHYIILRGQAWALFGDVDFWDERPVSGSVHRVSTKPFAWAREAAQVEVAWRFPVLGEELMFGIFHDFSVFNDRSEMPMVPARLGWGNAFGPSLHSLLFHFFAIDVFYGFGFRRYGAGKVVHTLTFKTGNVF